MRPLTALVLLDYIARSTCISCPVQLYRRSRNSLRLKPCDICELSLYRKSCVVTVGRSRKGSYPQAVGRIALERTYSTACNTAVGSLEYLVPLSARVQFDRISVRTGNLIPFQRSRTARNLICVKTRHSVNRCNRNRFTDKAVVICVFFARTVLIAIYLETGGFRITLIISESMTAYGCNALGYLYAKQSRAATKRLFTDGCNTLRYGYVGKHFTAVKSTLVDYRHTFRYYHFCECFTTHKRTSVYARNAVRYAYIRKPFAESESITVYLPKILRQLDVCQITAPIECVFSDACNAVRYRYILQQITACKCTLAYARNTVGYRHV